MSNNTQKKNLLPNSGMGYVRTLDGEQQHAWFASHEVNSVRIP
jgi:hypothetical protein